MYLEIPKFDKELSELENDYDRWLYAFKNLHRLRETPKELEQGIFKKLFDLAEIAKMDDKDRSVYEDSLKDYRDLKSAIDTYYNEGKAEGKIEVVKNAIMKGFDNQTIVDLTGLAVEEVEQLRKGLK